MSLFSKAFANILGIGIDLVDSRRIQRALLRYPHAFAERIFTEQETAYANAANKPALSYAKRFAAKEAFAKATGLGIGGVIGWKDVEVVSQKTGQPCIVLSSSCYEALKIRWGQSFRTLVSLSDESPYAQAFVVITTMTESDVDAFSASGRL